MNIKKKFIICVAVVILLLAVICLVIFHSGNKDTSSIDKANKINTSITMPEYRSVVESAQVPFNVENMVIDGINVKFSMYEIKGGVVDTVKVDKTNIEGDLLSEMLINGIKDKLNERESLVEEYLGLINDETFETKSVGLFEDEKRSSGAFEMPKYVAFGKYEDKIYNYRSNGETEQKERALFSAGCIYEGVMPVTKFTLTISGKNIENNSAVHLPKYNIMGDYNAAVFYAECDTLSGTNVIKIMTNCTIKNNAITGGSILIVAK